MKFANVVLKLKNLINYGEALVYVNSEREHFYTGRISMADSGSMFIRSKDIWGGQARQCDFGSVSGQLDVLRVTLRRGLVSPGITIEV